MADKPKKKFRIGLLTASIWKNDQFYGVTLQRSYKDGEEWKEAQNMGHNDLLNAARLLQRCEEWIADQ